jgi:hypothetical protein
LYIKSLFGVTLGQVKIGGHLSSSNLTELHSAEYNFNLFNPHIVARQI